MCVCVYLGGSEAEGSGVGIRSLPLQQHQAPLLSQRQVVTAGQVTQAEGLTPADVAPTPAVTGQGHTQTYTHTGTNTHTHTHTSAHKHTFINNSLGHQRLISLNQIMHTLLPAVN